MSLVIFAEEYSKVTKGTFLVWTTYVKEAAKKAEVHVLLNREHWGYAEATSIFGESTPVMVHRIPFSMPSSQVNSVLSRFDRVRVVRIGKLILGNILNSVVAPFVMINASRFLKRVKATAVISHSGGWPGGPLCRLIILGSAINRVPERVFVIHSHPQRRDGVLGMLLRPIRAIQTLIVEACATHIVTVSDSVKGSLETEVFSRSVFRIYNGLSISDSPGVKKRACSNLEWRPSGMAVGFVGAVSPHKGAHVLIDAFKDVETCCELALLGPGDENFLKILRKKAELCKNKVSFLGFHEDIESFMQRIDVLVIPAVAFESFGLVALEAMKYRKPVVCSDYGGMKEVVQHAVTGLVTPAGDSEALAQALNQLLADPSMRDRMGDAGFRRLSTMFTSNNMANQYNELVKLG